MDYTKKQQIVRLLDSIMETANHVYGISEADEVSNAMTNICSVAEVIKTLVRQDVASRAGHNQVKSFVMKYVRANRVAGTKEIKEAAKAAGLKPNSVVSALSQLKKDGYVKKVRTVNREAFWSVS